MALLRGGGGEGSEGVAGRFGEGLGKGWRIFFITSTAEILPARKGTKLSPSFRRQAHPSLRDIQVILRCFWDSFTDASPEVIHFHVENFEMFVVFPSSRLKIQRPHESRDFWSLMLSLTRIINYDFLLQWEFLSFWPSPRLRVLISWEAPYVAIAIHLSSLFCRCLPLRNLLWHSVDAKRHSERSLEV